MTPALLLTAGLETALNRYLRLDADALTRLKTFSGKVIAVEFQGLGLTLYFLPGPDGIQVADVYAGASDVLIRGTPLALFRQTRPGGPTAAGDLEIEGDVHLGKDFQALLAGIQIDWEEHLSRWVGDAAARQIGQAVGSLRAWGRTAADALLRNAGAYLQQEVRDLPPKGAMEACLDAVDTVRADTDRLEARIRRLSSPET